MVELDYSDIDICASVNPTWRVYIVTLYMQQVLWTANTMRVKTIYTLQKHVGYHGM